MKLTIIASAIFTVAFSLSLPAQADMKHHSGEGKASETRAENAQLIESKGTFDKAMPDRNKVVLRHEPIPELGWPAMKMTFTTAKDVNLDVLTKGEEVRFVLDARGGKNTIVELDKAQ